jgi:hypothetical protein
LFGLTALHNYIRSAQYEVEDDYYLAADLEIGERDLDQGDRVENILGEEVNDSKGWKDDDDMVKFRNRMAEEMWLDYCRIQRQRHIIV